MAERQKPNRTKTYVNWVARRLALMLFDGLVVYFASFLALVVRFTTANQVPANCG